MNTPRSDRGTELHEERERAVGAAHGILAGMCPELEESDVAWDALYDLYDDGFSTGAQDEYSYPS
jgi:hypothetical protein